MNTNFSSPGESNHTDEKHRQTSFSPSPLEKLQGKGGRLRYLIGIVSCAAVLVLGLGEHYATVVPLEKDLLSREVRCLAQEIDATVKLRSAVVSMAAGTVEVDALLANGRLDKFLATLREQLPDFLSLEIISDRGEVVAMIGDLPLSQAGIPGQARANRFVRVSSDIKSNEGLFADDPENGCLSVTCRHITPGKGQWFSRSRFSRDSIDQLLSSFPNRKAALVQVTGGQKAARSNHDWNLAATSGRWWQGADKAEALLASPGWLVRVENTAGGSVFRSLSVLVPAILLCVVAIAFVARMFSSTTSEAQPQQKGTAPQSCSHEQDEVTAQNGMDESSTSPDSTDSATAQEPNKTVSAAETENSTEAKESLTEVHLPEQDLTAPQSCSHEQDEVTTQNGMDESSTSPDSTDLAAAQELNKTVSATETENSTEAEESLTEVHLPADSEADSLQCAFPCCAIAVPDPPQDPETSIPPDEYPEVGKSLPDEMELPEDHFVVSNFSSEGSVADESEPVVFDIEAELTLDEAAALCGDTEIIVGEPISVELDFSEERLDSDPARSPVSPRTGYYSAVILGPPESAKDRCTGREALKKAQDEDFPETIEISWTEPASGDTLLKPDGKPSQEEHTEVDRWRGHYTS